MKVFILMGKYKSGDGSIKKEIIDVYRDMDKAKADKMEYEKGNFVTSYSIWEYRVK